MTKRPPKKCMHCWHVYSDPEAAFPKDRNRADGLNYVCRWCLSDYFRERRKNPVIRAKLLEQSERSKAKRQTRKQKRRNHANRTDSPTA